MSFLIDQGGTDRINEIEVTPSVEGALVPR